MFCRLVFGEKAPGCKDLCDCVPCDPLRGLEELPCQLIRSLPTFAHLLGAGGRSGVGRFAHS
eukprot:5907722-Prorocentrum_lima.AAC.1